MNKEIFCQRLKSLRVSRGLTQKAVAEAIGMTETGYQNYEVLRRFPTIEKLVDIADFFEVSLDYLCGRD